jgi:hypothetical protein
LSSIWPPAIANAALLLTPEVSALVAVTKAVVHSVALTYQLTPKGFRTVSERELRLGSI